MKCDEISELQKVNASTKDLKDLADGLAHIYILESRRMCAALEFWCVKSGLQVDLMVFLQTVVL